MKFTVRLVPNFKKKDSDGRSPVRICIACQNQRTYVSTGKKVKKADWNGKQVKHIVSGAGVLNNLLRNKVTEIENKINAAELRQGKLTMAIIKRELSGKQVDDDFYGFWKEIEPDLKKDLGAETVKNIQNAVDRIVAFQPGVHFSDITPAWLRKYKSHLIDQEYANNTIHKHWKQLTNIFNRARAEGITDNYPFTNFKNPKYVQTIRTFLIIEEVDLIEEALLKPLTEYQVVTANYFLLGCYSGLRFSDWQRWNHKGFVQEDRILLGTKKTGEIIGMQMHDRLKAVVERLRDLPPIYSEAKTNEYLKAVAIAAGITKHITTHVARHTYATHCLRKKIPDDVICQTMGITKKTLLIYKHLIDSYVDEEILSGWNEKKERPAPGTVLT